MRAYELYLKEEYKDEAMLELLSNVFYIDSEKIVIVSEFTGDEDIEGKSLLCILSQVGGEFKTNIVLYPYKEELCKLTSFELGEQFSQSTISPCLVFKGTDNPYLYTIIDSKNEYDVLVDDSLLEEEDKICILKTGPKRDGPKRNTHSKPTI
jgi:hypothetical protein